MKGINLLNALYYSQDASIPVAFELVKKPIKFCALKTRKVKHISEVTKNEQIRTIIHNCLNNQLKFKYILMDSWFSSKENFEFIVKKKKPFVAALKDNRLLALSLADKQQGHFVRISSLELQDKQAVRVWLKGFDREVLLLRQIAHTSGDYAKQPCIYVNLRSVQAGNIKD